MTITGRMLVNDHLILLLSSHITQFEIAATFRWQAFLGNEYVDNRETKSEAKKRWHAVQIMQQRIRNGERCEQVMTNHIVQNILRGMKMGSLAID